MPTIAEILIDKFTREKDEGRFQLFADRFAEVYLPEVFENINYFSGMNERHHSTTGHPDAWKRYRNGIACLEASTINDSGLRSKVEKDITTLSEKLMKSNLHATFALIVLTALHDKKPTDSSEIDANLRSFIQTSLGLKDNEIEIIFGYQLVSILEKPQYAPLLRRHYGIQNSYGPLHLITDDIRFKHPSYQFPEIEAFENSKVYVSSDLSDNCVRILDEDSALLLKGLSGSGKTVFSFILAFHFKNRNYDCLYLDLREQNSFQLKDFIDFVQTNGHKRMFVLIDNAQLCPALIQDYHQIRSAQKDKRF